MLFFFSTPLSDLRKPAKWACNEMTLRNEIAPLQRKTGTLLHLHLLIFTSLDPTANIKRPETEIKTGKIAPPMHDILGIPSSASHSPLIWII